MMAAIDIPGPEVGGGAVLASEEVAAGVDDADRVWNSVTMMVWPAASTDHVEDWLGVSRNLARRLSNTWVSGDLHGAAWGRRG